jgi:hypothetical protein
VEQAVLDLHLVVEKGGTASEREAGAGAGRRSAWLGATVKKRQNKEKKRSTKYISIT